MKLFVQSKKAEKKDFQRRFGLPVCILVSVASSYAMYGAAVAYWTHPLKFYIFFGTGTAIFTLCAILLIRMSRVEPSSTEVDAIAWMLRNSPEPNPIWFRNAFKIAEPSLNFRVQLLEQLLPLAEPLIIQPLEDGVRGITPLQTEYLHCLQSLTENLQPRKGRLLRNEPPIPSKSLKRELEKLKNVKCPPCIVRMGTSTHVVGDGEKGCPLCTVRDVANVALENFDHRMEYHLADRTFLSFLGLYE